MAEIHPFRGVHYNESLVKDLSAVICPPYDIITPQLQQELYIRSEYNFVRLEFGQELPQDTATDNKYTRSAAILEQWLKQGILKIDETPAMYLHNQYFTHQGKEYKRRGLIARVRLEEWDRMVIRPHEGTTAEPKSDRLSLLWALQANTSPILTLFQDEGKPISSLLTTQERSQPLINSVLTNGEGHQVWAITEHRVVQQISHTLAGQPLYVADGHHRYESALAYQRERRACSPPASGDEAFNFVMVELVAFADPGLVILPPHRLVRGLPKSTLDGLSPKLKEFFEVEELPLSMPDVWQQVDHLLVDTREIRLVLFGPDAEHLFVLTLHAPAAVSQMMPQFHSDLYKTLDVSIIDHIILEKLLLLDSNKEKLNLAYT
ncbi:MAG: DUF1015 domain-containing protein, partial [Chloroflexi bacterium]|nr:DUF1015 domain-containing protein [Chloroflexota bacterium]